MQKSFLKLLGVTLFTSLLLTLSGCGGGNAGPAASSLQNPAQSITVRGTPSPTVTPRPRPTATPKPVPTSTPSGPPPLSPPAVVFDLRGRTLVGGIAQGGVAVQVKGLPGAVTAADRTVSGAGGFYSFFLGGGTYVVTAAAGKHTLTRRVTIPPGGQTVDKFDLNL